MANNLEFARLPGGTKKPTLREMEPSTAYRLKFVQLVQALQTPPEDRLRGMQLCCRGLEKLFRSRAFVSNDAPGFITTLGNKFEAISYNVFDPLAALAGVLR